MSDTATVIEFAEQIDAQAAVRMFRESGRVASGGVSKSNVATGCGTTSWR